MVLSILVVSMAVVVQLPTEILNNDVLNTII
jgi:hypothetical protein